MSRALVALLTVLLALLAAPGVAAVPVVPDSRLEAPEAPQGALPRPPAGAVKLSVAPAAYCGETEAVYEEAWDVNPETQAAVAYYGRAVRSADGSPSFEPPLAMRVDDDEGSGTFFQVVDGRLVKMSAREFAEKYDYKWCGVIGR